jgi:hypothetical protein
MIFGWISNMFAVSLHVPWSMEARLQTVHMRSPLFTVNLLLAIRQFE